MPISVMTIEALSSIGKMWLGMATSPMVAITAEMASSTGTPAATSAPNAITRMSRVTGSDSVSARFRSLAMDFEICSADAGVAELLDAQLGIGLLGGLDRRLHGRDPIPGRVGRTADLELDERGVAVLRDQVTPGGGRWRRARS